MSTNVLQTLLSANNVAYLKSKDLLGGKSELPNLRKLQHAVTNEKHVYAIDFTDTNGIEDGSSLKQMVLSKFAVHFPCDLLIVTRYKDGVLFTPIDDMKNPDVATLLTPGQIKKLMKRSTDSDSFRKQRSRRSTSKDGNDQTVPNISFYLNIQYNIPSSLHTFAESPSGFYTSSKTFCKNPHISLIFQVNLQRSLKFGSSGSATPDAKIVRISADANTGGAGIHLNDKLTYQRYDAPWIVYDGYLRDWATSAIASDYTVDVSASNGKASVLKTMPQNNINPGTEFRDVSGFTLGVTAGVEVSKKDGPKAKLDASASYTQSRWITFSTHDYKMVRIPGGTQSIKFKMMRETYPKASSLINRSTDPIWVRSYPADLKRVQPMGYAGYVPKLDVVYKADKDETGTTDFSVTASVGIMPLYHAVYQHFYGIGAHLSYHGTGYDRDGTQASCKKGFSVDWEHAVFTGGRPVNLQSKAFADKCIEVDSNGKISLAKGDLSSEKQSFIYDEYGRYKSAKHLKMCLDATNLDMLQPCGSSLTQRWEWEKGTNHLTNFYLKGRLGCDKSTKKLGFHKGDTDTVSTEFITAYTELFSSH